MRFEITLPLTHRFNDHSRITFSLEDGQKPIIFEEGIHYLDGENGAGKSTFLSILSLLSGSVGKAAGDESGKIKYGREAYADQKFDYLKAAEIRENDFCIFSQDVFFLPGLTIKENYRILNRMNDAGGFPSDKYASSLSGGEQQERFIRILLQENKKVWFLDEPFNNLDQRNRQRFWELLKTSYSESPKIIFLIDHGMSNIAENNEHFILYTSLRVSSQNREDDPAFLKIYSIQEPIKFLEGLAVGTKKHPN